MNLSAPFIQRPVMTTFVMATLLLAGWIAYLKLPVSDLPPVEQPHIQITAGYSGANPEAVLNQVTIPLEKELTHVKGVTEMDSTSSLGFSSISLTFDLSKDMDEAIRDVQRALKRAEVNLPNDLDPRPSYELQEDSQDPIIWYALTSDQSTVGEMRNYTNAYILPRLNRIEGVAQVKVYGAEKSIWVRLNPDLMAARHIGFNEVADTVKQHTSQMPLGTIQGDSKRLSIEWPSTVQQPKEIENLKIGNTSVRIKDIGEVSDKSDLDREFRFVVNGKGSSALFLGIQKISNGNTVAIAQAVHEAMASVEKEMPKGIKIHLWFDKSVWIKHSLVDVQWSLVIAFALVVLVIYLSLGRVAESLITSAALPLSLIGTFIIMYLSDFSLDLLSLLALTLAVGFVVDDAIVVLENIVRHHEKGDSPRQASLLGSQQICFTILSMTLSLVAVFIPILFMSGMNGRLFREFSITLAVAILVSGFVSLTLTPMLCSRFLSAHKAKDQTPLQKKITAANDWMITLYGKTLKRCLHFPKSIIVFAALCMAATVLLFSKLPVQLIPPEDRGYFFSIVNLPSGLSAAQTNEFQKKLEGLFIDHPHIDKFISLNMDFFNMNSMLLYVFNLLPIDQRPPQNEVMASIQGLFDTVPGIQTFSQPYQLIQLDLEFGQPGSYKFIVNGQEFADVDQASRLLTKELQSHPEFSFVQNSLNNDQPVLAMNVNEELSHKLGFNKQQIQRLPRRASHKVPSAPSPKE